MAKKTAVRNVESNVQTARNVNTQPAANTVAVALDDSMARMVERITKNTGLSREEVVRRAVGVEMERMAAAVARTPAGGASVKTITLSTEDAQMLQMVAAKTGSSEEDLFDRLLELGIDKLAETLTAEAAKVTKAAAPFNGNAIPSPAKATEAATPSTDTGDAAKASGEASLWKLRNAEIDKARVNSGPSHNLTIMEAMTPANGEWILAELEETLDRMNLLDENGVVLALMMEFEFYHICFESRSIFRQTLGELLTRDITSRGFVSKQAKMVAMHLDEVAPGFFSRKKLLELGAALYHESVG